ncbi:MAG TPA: hypothetical protein VN371_02085 [Chlorobaculum sp.]|nr:hypothetical protein [Chlorobaculum sp.]
MGMLTKEQVNREILLYETFYHQAKTRLTIQIGNQDKLPVKRSPAAYTNREHSDFPARGFRPDHPYRKTVEQGEQRAMMPGTAAFDVKNKILNGERCRFRNGKDA